MPRTIYELVPEGWPCRLADCPPGHFRYKDTFGFKSEYHSDTGRDLAFNGAGEYLSDPDVAPLREDLIVQPCIVQARDMCGYED